MSVFGVDFGALNSVVAVTRQGGVDIVCNEVSKRETATFVSYLNDERLIGEAGFDKVVRNAANTVACVKRLVGLRADDERVKSEMRFVNCATTSDKDGRLQLDVNYNGEMTALYPEQVLAAFLGKLRKYVALETKLDAKDCVVSVPVWYNAEQRRLVVQACEMAGLNNLSLVNETTAASVDYGIFRGSLLPETEADANTVAIIDVGYAGTTISISKFWKGNMRVLVHEWDHEVSTREIDYALFNHFAAEIKKKYHVDPLENKRARIRLLQGCDKLKCMLSANAQAPLNIENLMDIDVSFMYKREDLEVLLQPLLDRLKVTIARALSRAGIEAGSLHSVEMIGGGSRIPGYKNTVSEGFGVQASFTLNASESIARGCAITAATFSPLFQVREYVVNEAPLCPLMLGYRSDKAEAASSISFLPTVNKTMAILRDSDRYPKTLELTFQRSDAFDLYAFYDENHDSAKHVPKGERSIVGQWTVGGPNGKTTSGSVKVRVKFHANGMMSIEGASTHETYEVEVEEKVKPAEKKAEDAAEAPKAEGDAAEGGDKPAGEKPKEEAKPETVRVKKQMQRRLELTVTPQLALGHAAEVFLAAKKAEADQDAMDLQIQRTREVRNELESYVYDNRSRIRDGDLKAFVTSADGEAFISLATEIEDWLYGDGETATAAEYQTRLDKLKVIGSAAIRRLRLSEDIPFAHGKFVKKVNVLKDLAAATIGKHEHITEEDLNGAIAKCDEALSWGSAELQSYEAKPKHEDPTIAPTTFDNKATEVEGAVKAVVNKKAPKKEKKEEPKKDDAAKADDAAAGDAPADAPAADADAPAADADAPAGGPKPATDLD